MTTTPTTTPTGAATCAETEPVDDRPEGEVAPEVGEAEARRRWLATAAWPEVAFAGV